MLQSLYILCSTLIYNIYPVVRYVRLTGSELYSNKQTLGKCQHVHHVADVRETIVHSIPSKCISFTLQNYSIYR